VTELRGPLQVWLADEGGWAEVLGISRTALEEQHAARPLPELAVDRVRSYRAVTDNWLEGNGTGEMRGLIAMFAEPYEPTPIQRALDILRPHLTTVPRYRASDHPATRSSK
jgi:hypothetical protein